jgi:hypothetical protein
MFTVKCNRRKQPKCVWMRTKCQPTAANKRPSLGCASSHDRQQYCNTVIMCANALSTNKSSLLVIGKHRRSRPGVGNLRHACQAWHAERFSMAR